MPHNFVVILPGSLEEIGIARPSPPPRSPGPSSGSSFRNPTKSCWPAGCCSPANCNGSPSTPPTQPGVYPYVCTYPGHWRRMYGAMYVVENLDDYLADPDHYLAHHMLPINDNLLKVVRTSKEWKPDDLADSVKELHGRSLANGKQLFQIGACVCCHKLERRGPGVRARPDQARCQVRRRGNPQASARSVAEIEEKYTPWTLVLGNGKIVAGTILKEDTQNVTVALADGQQRVISVAEIDEREKSKVSIMPQGVLNRLTREEILDLVAPLVVRGDEKSDVFGEHHH